MTGEKFNHFAFYCEYIFWAVSNVKCCSSSARRVLSDFMISLFGRGEGTKKCACYGNESTKATTFVKMATDTHGAAFYLGGSKEAAKTCTQLHKKVPF